MEDREKLKTLERVQEEKEKYETIIQKLQQKYAPQQQEITELRKQMKDMETEVAEMEEIKAEHDMILEMATLDREMAEEQSEAYKAELDAVRAKAEEYEMEIEILREENEELGSGMTPEEKTSSGWLQLEKQNERLRDALLRLREITSQTEDELKDTVRSLEEDNTELQKYKDEYETNKAPMFIFRSVSSSSISSAPIAASSCSRRSSTAASDCIMRALFVSYSSLYFCSSGLPSRIWRV